MVFSWVRVTRSLVVFLMFCRSLFVLVLLAICCLFFFYLRILITPLLSSNSFKVAVKLLYILVEIPLRLFVVVSYCIL
jgi:hypothetical protein